MPSIKQVLPAEKTIGVRAFVRTPFHTPCPARYSVLHLLGVLSGGNEPPLCKGRWLAKQDGRFVKAKISSKTIPQPPSASALNLSRRRQATHFVHCLIPPVSATPTHMLRICVNSRFFFCRSRRKRKSYQKENAEISFRALRSATRATRS